MGVVCRAQDGEGADPMKLLQQTTTAMQPGQKASRNSAAATKQLEYLASIGANVEIAPHPEKRKRKKAAKSSPKGPEPEPEPESESESSSPGVLARANFFSSPRAVHEAVRRERRPSMEPTNSYACPTHHSPRQFPAEIRIRL